MKGLDADERGVLETLVRPEGECREDWCGGGAGDFPDGQVAAVWRLVARGLAVATPCSAVPGLQHVVITPDGLMVLNLVKTADGTPVEKL